MASTADVILNQIVAPRLLQLAQAVGQVLLLDRIREGDASQPRSINEVGALRLSGLEAVVAAMEENMDAPLKTTELAEMVGFSVRQLERRFQNFVGQSPAAFYRSLRLHRARNLVEQTTLPLCEVAIADFAKLVDRFEEVDCSFVSVTHPTSGLPVTPYPASDSERFSANRTDPRNHRANQPSTGMACPGTPARNRVKTTSP